jgi:hypothetical protein
MKQVGDFLDLLAEKLNSFTGLGETLSYIIVFFGSIALILWILKKLFGGSSKSPSYPIKGSQGRQYGPTAEERESVRRANEQIAKDRRSRAEEISDLETLEGRRRNQGW